MHMDADLVSPPLVRTKLHPPSLPDDCISRGRLIQLLEESRSRPLVVVSAPAGYGKTVLACEWKAQLACDSAWFSVDKNDGDLHQFLTYLVICVEDVVPGALLSLTDQLDSSEMAPLPVLAASLINDLDRLRQPLVIFFDDFDRIDNDSPVFDLLSLLLERPPQGLQLVILSRRSLPLDLGRLRAAAQILEIRMRDLRFSASESAALMGAAVKTTLTESALAHLGDELEGWPVGLRLVALMIARSSDPSSAVEGLHGGIPQAQDYLFSEVLSGLDSDIRRSLLESSVLERFSAELLDRVCFIEEPGSGLDGQSFIRALSRNNLFAFSIDSTGNWYRYHHWFQFMLQSLLLEEQGASSVRELHLRAADWFASKNETEEAVAHFLQAGEADQAADLIVQVVHRVLEKNRWQIIERWISMLPESTRAGRADVQLAYAWAAFCKLDIERVRDSVVKAEVLLDSDDRRRDLACQFDLLYGWLEFWRGNLAEAEDRLQSSLAGFPLSSGMIAGEARLYLALATGLSGEYTRAVEFLAKERASSGRDAGLAFLLRVIGGQAHLYCLSGDIDSATCAVDRMKRVRGFNQSGYSVGWAEYMHGLYDFNRGAFGPAIEHFAKGRKHIGVLERRAAVDLLAGTCLALQLAGKEQGLVTDAWEELDSFVRNYELDEFTWIVESVSARLSIQLDESDVALEWAESVIVPEVHPVEALFWICNPVETRARVLALFGRGDALSGVLEQLDKLLEGYREYHNVCRIIDIQSLRAVALSRQGELAEAQRALGEAVLLGSTSRWRRTFLELGEPVFALLSRLDVSHETASFVQQLLGEEQGEEAVANRSRPQSIAVRVDTGNPPLDAIGDDNLTNRELDILELLEQRLQNKEIAARLHISPHTVGYHLKHIYQKLAVNGRRQAVVRARAAGIL